MRILSTLLFCVFWVLSVNCQVTIQNKPFKHESPSVDYRYSVYTTYLSLTNFGKPETNTHHYEIQFAYQLTQRDRIGIKAATWKLFAPMGIPIWDDKFLDREAFYPGRLKEMGIGITYQRKLWKGLFAAIELLPLRTEYISDEGNTLSKGFKLYNSYHIGYQIPLFKKGRIFIEPQIHVNHWMSNTNVPGSFKNEEAKWNNYFLIEPNIYLGIKF